MTDTTEPEIRPTYAAPDSSLDLHRLTQASCVIHSATSLRETLQAIANEARSIIGAHQAKTRMILGEHGSRVIQAISLSDKYAAWRNHDLPALCSGLDLLVCRENQPMRMTQTDLANHPAWDPADHAVHKLPPMRGWLAIPLISAEGRNFGLLQLTDKRQGDFSAEDESLLSEFGRMAALALENAWRNRGVEIANQTLLHRLRAALLHAEIGENLVTASDLPMSLQACADLLAKYLNAACAQVWVLQDETLELAAHCGPSLPSDLTRCQINVGASNVARVASTRRPCLTDALLDDPRLRERAWLRAEGLRTFAGYPLLIGDRLEGVVALFHRAALPATSIEALSAAARVIAQAVMRSRAQANVTCRTRIVSPENGTMRTPHAIIVQTLDGVIRDWNAGAEQLFGYSRAEAVGQGIAVLVPPEALDEHHETMQCVGRGEEISHAQTTRLHKSGARLDVCVTAAPLRDHDGRCSGAVLAVHDLTETRRLSHQYQRAQKMEAFGRLAGGVVHDFNNMLTVILGYSEVLISRCDADNSKRGLVAEIHKAGKRAEALIRQLLMFNGKKAPEPQVLDLNTVVADTEKMLRRLIGENILVTTIFHPRLPPIKADPSQVQQVILNLAVNARDAMPDGGRLTIETGAVTRDQAYARGHRHVRPGNYVLLALADTGTGMSDATQARLFQPLFTTKDPSKGTGLGLATVDAIVRECGGHIEVVSKLGQGATFTICLPTAPVPSPAAAPRVEPGMMPPGTETILLVEDEEVVRTLAARVLQMCGYTVLEAKNGEEALWVGVNHTGPIHLLVSDVVMPLLGGRPLAERLLVLNPRLKVLFLSGYPSDVVVNQGILGAEFAFLQKPFATGALAQKVRQVLDRQ